MFFLLLMAILICFLSGFYLIGVGSDIWGVILLVLGALLVVFTIALYSRKSRNTFDCIGVDCGDVFDCDCNGPDCGN